MYRWSRLCARTRNPIIIPGQTSFWCRHYTGWQGAVCSRQQNRWVISPNPFRKDPGLFRILSMINICRQKYRSRRRKWLYSLGDWLILRIRPCFSGHLSRFMRSIRIIYWSCMDRIPGMAPGKSWRRSFVRIMQKSICFWWAAAMNCRGNCQRQRSMPFLLIMRACPMPCWRLWPSACRL